MDLKSENNSTFLSKLKKGIQSFVKLSVCLYLILLSLRIFEIIENNLSHTLSGSILKIAAFAFVYDLLFWCKLSGWLLLVYLPLHFISGRLARIVFITAIVIFFICNALLIQYFNSALVPLGADLYGYTLKDIELTVGTGGSLSKVLLVVFAAFTIGLSVALVRLYRGMQVNTTTSIIIVLCFLITTVFNPLKLMSGPRLATEYLNDLTLNKANFFIDESLDHFFPLPTEVDIYAENYLGLYEDQNDSLATFSYVDGNTYPFLHVENTPDVLSPFFNVGMKKPNIVVVMVEGLGRAYSNAGAEFGSFTPFLDSLSKHSLYWDNFLSQGGRTFAILPALLASLPFGDKGFLALGNDMPAHLSLMNVLKYNGYNTGFYYGGHADFDNMNIFFKRNSTDAIYDENTFTKDYEKMPLSPNGYTWGFGDKELFRHYFQVLNSLDTAKPYLSVLLTISSHFPFLINEQQAYLQKFRDRMDYLNLEGEAKAERSKDANAFASILYADDALKSLIAAYEKRPEFNNTIFVITGDHRIPELAMSTKIDRFHVPFIIYSPLLKRSARFSSISTHADVTPSLLSFLTTGYRMQSPSLTSWVGTGLDTSKTFRNKHAYALKQSKHEEIDFVMDNYQLHNSTLFLIGSNMDVSIDNDDKKADLLSAAFNAYKQRNSRFIGGAKLLPDSIIKRFNETAKGE